MENIEKDKITLRILLLFLLHRPAHPFYAASLFSINSPITDGFTSSIDSLFSIDSLVANRLESNFKNRFTPPSVANPHTTPTPSIVNPQTTPQADCNYFESLSGTQLVVSGERQVRHNKNKQFEQSFELPKNAGVVKITWKLNGEILYVTIPKKVEQEYEENKI